MLPLPQWGCGLRSISAICEPTGRSAQHVAHLGVEILKTFAKLVDVSRGRPRLDRKFRLGLAGDEVDLAAIRLDIVDHDVAIRSPPFGAIADLISVQQRRRNTVR